MPSLGLCINSCQLGVGGNYIYQHIVNIDNKHEEYTRVLAESDRDNQEIIRDEIKKQQERKNNY